jgi:hypothetical protein
MPAKKPCTISWTGPPGLALVLLSAGLALGAGGASGLLSAARVVEGDLGAPAPGPARYQRWSLGQLRARDRVSVELRDAGRNAMCLVRVPDRAGLPREECTVASALPAGRWTMIATGTGEYEIAVSDALGGGPYRLRLLGIRHFLGLSVEARQLPRGRFLVTVEARDGAGRTLVRGPGAVTIMAQWASGETVRLATAGLGERLSVRLPTGARLGRFEIWARSPGRRGWLAARSASRSFPPVS